MKVSLSWSGVTSRWVSIALVFALTTVAVIAAGCGEQQTSAGPADRESTFARSIIDAVYSGSMTSVQGSLGPGLQSMMPDHVMGGVAGLLREDYGDVVGVQRSPGTPASSGGPSTEAVWTVQAERDTFEMKVARDANGAATGIWFRSSSAEGWSTAVDLSKAYVRRQVPG
jgi:hypothetical protein